MLFIGIPNERNQFLFKNGDYNQLEVSGDSTILTTKSFSIEMKLLVKIQKYMSLNEEEKDLPGNKIIIDYQNYLCNQ